ncbi:MAG: phosphodiester glycosidase family protein, partial [Patescibacteria group bacterium]
MSVRFLKQLKIKSFHIHKITGVLFILLVGLFSYGQYRQRLDANKQSDFENNLNSLTIELDRLKLERDALIASQSALLTELETLKNEDLRKINAETKAKIAQVETVFRLASITIESFSDARYQGINTSAFEGDLAKAISLLSQLKYDEANTQLSTINKKVTELTVVKTAQIAAQASPAQDPPVAGSYRRQSVTTSRGSFVVSLIAEQTGSIKMITDSASDDTCTNNCAVLPLATYVSRNSGFAGINGSYFCPSDYPSCSDKVNSFNTLIFNSRLKKYLNSDQNVYSLVPLVVQNADHSLRFMGASQEWGRDTGIFGGIANQPLLVSGGHALVTESGGKGPRGFIGVKNSTLYIGVVNGADLGDAASVLATLGLETALNLDG